MGDEAIGFHIHASALNQMKIPSRFRARERLGLRGFSSLLLIAGICSLCGSTAAFASEDPPKLYAVENRVFPLAKRWEVGVYGSAKLVQTLTTQFEVGGGLAYNFNEYFALELRGGYGISSHTSLAKRITSLLASNQNITKIDDFRDVREMRGNAIIGVRFTPLYGKFNLFEVIPVHLQLFFWAGGGVAFLERQSFVICVGGITSDGTCKDPLSEKPIAPMFSVAVGVRAIFLRHHAIFISVRDYGFPDSFYTGVTRQEITASKPTANGTQVNGLTNLVVADFGYSFVF